MHHEKPRVFSHALLFVLVLLSFHVPATFAATGLAITEIMYDPAGSDTNREWIEVYNSGSAAIDLADHYFLTDGLQSTHHALVTQGSSSIAAGGYAVIVQNVDAFKSDYPDFAGQIFDSSWSGLTANVGKTLLLVDSEGAALDQVTYDPSLGATNDGNSLQKTVAGNWIAALPTPANATVATNTTENSSDSNDSSTDTSASQSSASRSSIVATPVKKSSAETPHTQMVLSLPKASVSGLSVPISIRVLDGDGLIRPYGVTHVAFGDGEAREGRPMESFTHTYAYPGTYIVSVEYRANQYQADPDVVSRATIEVTAPAVDVSQPDRDGSIKLSNTGKTEADISGWILRADTPPTVFFRLPAGTIILPGKTITLPQRITGLSPAQSDTIGLFLPSGVSAGGYAKNDAVLPTILPHAASSVGLKSAPIVRTLAAAAMPLPLEKETPRAVPPIKEEYSRRRSAVPFVVGLLGVIIGAVIALYKLKVIAKKEEGPGTDAGQDAEGSEAKKLADEIRILDN